MGIRSKALYEYLLDSGALGAGNDEVIQKAKKKYRLEYLRNWRRKHRETHDEVRILIPSEDVKELNRAVKRSGLTKVDYLKRLILGSLGNPSSEKGHPVLHQAYTQIGLLINELNTSCQVDDKVMNRLIEIEESLGHVLNS